LRYKDQVEVIEANVQADYVVEPVPTIKKTPLLGGHLWSCSYCVSTVGIDEEKIWKYVKSQKEQGKRYEVEHKRLFD
jgi:hypothetical protein